MIATIITIILCTAGVIWLATMSVQSLRQSRFLDALPKGIASAEDGACIALHGPVKVLVPASDPGAGPYLWRRVIHKQLETLAEGILWGRRRWRVVADEWEIAHFVILIDNEELEIADPPTEVQGTRTRRDSDSEGYLNDMVYGGSTVRVCEWLPVQERVTVIGRVERQGNRRVIVADPELGLLLSPHDPVHAARIELAKAVGGLLGAAASLLVVMLMIARLL